MAGRGWITPVLCLLLPELLGYLRHDDPEFSDRRMVHHRFPIGLEIHPLAHVNVGLLSPTVRSCSSRSVSPSHRPVVSVLTVCLGTPPRFSISPNELVCPVKNFVGWNSGRPRWKSETFMVAQLVRTSAAQEHRRRMACDISKINRAAALSECTYSNREDNNGNDSQRLNVNAQVMSLIVRRIDMPEMTARRSGRISVMRAAPICSN